MRHVYGSRFFLVLLQCQWQQTLFTENSKNRQTERNLVTVHVNTNKKTEKYHKNTLGVPFDTHDIRTFFLSILRNELFHPRHVEFYLV